MSDIPDKQVSSNPVVIFYQAGKNRRIGNSIKWVGPALAWCQKNKFEFFFPKARDVFDGVLDEKSNLFQVPEILKKSNLFSENMVLEKNNPVIDKFLYRCVVSAKEVGAATAKDEQYLSILPGHLGVIQSCVSLNWSQAELLALIKSHKITIINEPFPFEVPDENIESLRKQNMLPSTEVVELENKLRQANLPVIGIHIRQTDYKTWLGGRLYKDNNFYNTVITGIIDKLKVTCNYHIAHDGEFVLEDNLTGRDNIKLSGGQEADVTSDFLSFSVCDYLLGSESTFTRQSMKLGRLWFSKNNRMIEITPGESADSLISKFVTEVEKREKLLCR